ncbi:MAG: zinc ABC transporter substrate-binding protein [Deltaproteobacteria bacterium]|nr:MAG: zinc ABC transporter substrate-binding protein [Deltaproteobacteria bacterium]
MKAFLLVGISVLMGMSLTLVAAEDSVATRKPVLVCSTTQIADFTREIVGDQCVVKSILAPGADPHTYMPTPQDAKIVLGADLCLQNGLHLEGKNWMGTLARDANKPLVTCTKGIKPIELEAEGEKIADPHAWFSARNVAVYVNNILRAVSRLDPSEQGRYAARAKLYLQQLRVLDVWVREQVNRISPQRRILVTSHDAFNYFCQEYKFNSQYNYLSLAPVGWSTGSEVGAGMTPRRRKKVIDSIRNYGAPAVFVETSVNPKLIREIAKEAGIDVGGKLYSDSMGESGTAGETYIGMMRENVLTIVTALKIGVKEGKQE